MKKWLFGLILSIDVFAAVVLGASPRPDVLILLTDQWSPRCLSWEDAQVVTPNLDRIAREGVIFDNCYTPSPLCMPARVSLVTGQYPHNHGVFGNPNNYHLLAAQATMFRDIRAAGYTTAQIGKLHWYSGGGWKQDYASLEEYDRAMGLDHCASIEEPYSVGENKGSYTEHLRELGLLDAYLKDMNERLLKDQYLVRPSVVLPQDHNDSFVADSALRWIEAQPKDKSWCLVASFPGPHPPMDAPGQYATMFDPAKIKRPANVPETFPYDGKTRDQAEIRRITANYLGKLALIDQNFGRLIAALEKRGTWTNTLVMFFADHGEMLGAHGALSKGRFWEESARVPLVVRWPDRVKVGHTSALVQSFDIYPTIIEAIGGKLSPGRFAHSFLTVASGKAGEVRQLVISEIGKEAPLDFMARDARYKWFAAKGKEYLFDLRQDPLEMQNLADTAEHERVLNQMREKMLTELRSTQVNVAVGSKSKVERKREAAEATKAGTAPAEKKSRVKPDKE